MSSDSSLPPEIAIRVRGLCKTYRICSSSLPGISLRDDLARLVSLRWLRREEGRDFRALHNVDLDVRPGEVLGLLGGNGAGKSTLLKTLCRITPPSAGTIAFRGRIAAVLEVGTGFHPDLSGRENIYLNGAILGMRRSEINQRFADIVQFSEIGEFLDEPVKHYSSGMHVRLAFSIAAHLEPDILVIDEVLAVGDEAFRSKCLSHVRTRFAGKAVIFVSHDMSAIRSVCTRTVVLEHGRLVFDGAVEEGIARCLSQAGGPPCV